MSKLLKLSQLESRGACQEQRRLFQTKFNQQIELTEELCVEHADEFDWDWAACRLLSVSGFQAYSWDTEPAESVMEDKLARLLNLSQSPRRTEQGAGFVAEYHVAQARAFFKYYWAPTQ